MSATFVPTESGLCVRFDSDATFGAVYEAERWLTEQGISYGSSQGDAPVGLMRGDVLIAKWRNLSQQERAELDGTMESANFRAGPVFVRLRDKGGAP